MEALRLASSTHLHSLSFDELELLAPHAMQLRVAAGRRLLLGGGLHHELALIGGGRALVRCAGETLAELGPGDVFGALSPRRTAYATATLTTLTALHLVVFSTRSVRTLRASAPDALDALLATCSLEVGERARALSGPRPAPALTLVAAAAA